MGTYGISTEEFLSGHLYPSLNEDNDSYGFEDFLSDFEGDVDAECIAEAWNRLAQKHKWNDFLKVVDRNI